MDSKHASRTQIPSIEQAPFPVATIGGPLHILKYANAAFCRFAKKAEENLVGKPFGDILGERVECIALMNRVYRSGEAESYLEQDHAPPRPAFSSYTIWPVTSHEPTVAIMIQVNATTPLYKKTLAMNEALVIGSLRQHELTATAARANMQLQLEAGGHKQRELDAWMLTNEISHRIKNNLQLITNLIGLEAKRTTVPCAQDYEVLQGRIGAIAELYDLMSQSSDGQTVDLEGYLREIGRTISESLLGIASGIAIEVKAEAVPIDPNRAVPFGLLVNELATNAIKHAFPGGTGSVVLGVRQTGAEIELVVADDGVGMRGKHSTKTSEKHGANYVAIFARQLGGTLALSESEGTGTTVTVRFPLILGA